MKLVDPGLDATNDLLDWGTVKSHLRLRVDNDETRLMQVMRGAALEIERRTNLVIVQRTFQIYFDGADLCKYGRQVLPITPIDTSQATTLEYFSGVVAGVQQWTAYTDYYIEESNPSALRFTTDASLPTDAYDTSDDHGNWRMGNILAGTPVADVHQRLRMAVLTQIDVDVNALIDGDRLITNLTQGFGPHGNTF